MKAAILQQIGDDKLEVRDDVSTVAPGPGEVRVRIRAAGVCHSDLSAMDGTLPALAPGILGHEGCGEVAEVGAGVGNVAVGDRVLFSFVPPCGDCANCVRGEPHLCPVNAIAAFTTPRFQVGETPAFGFGGVGTFAEELVAPAAAVVRIPDDVPFDVGCLVSCGVMTGVGAVVNTARVAPGSTVAVIGCGGVGISVIQGARLAGAAAIVAVDPIVAKHDLAKRFGATQATTPEGLAAVRDEVTGGEGFDYAFDVVGIPATIRSAYDTARRGGAAVVVGAGRSDAMVEFSTQELFMQERTILGSFYGSANVRRDFPMLLDLWRAGRLELEPMISRRLALEEINDALQALKSGRGDLIRQVVTYE